MFFQNNMFNNNILLLFSSSFYRIKSFQNPKPSQKFSSFHMCSLQPELRYASRRYIASGEHYGFGHVHPVNCLNPFHT